MKIVQINSVFYGSTGKIMLDIANEGRSKHEFLLCYPRGRHNKQQVTTDSYLFGNRVYEDLHILLGRITGLQGCFSYGSTKMLLKKIREFNPDVIHLHNLHNSYVNIPMLMRFIKREKIRTIWTLHDCWAFTGHCPHFQNPKCDKWKQKCNKCSCYNEYPKSYVDHSRYMHFLKKQWFLGIQEMNIVVPSKWLENLVKESFLSCYPTTTIHNGIDLNIFTPRGENVREQYDCKDKHIILGVSFGWDEKKGLDTFIELATVLDERYQIILVGTDCNIEKILPHNIISIQKTSNQYQLAELYTAADVFVNPTKQDVLGLVNIEALACGTPVIVNNVGGCPECIDDTCGIVVNTDRVDVWKKAIEDTITNKSFSAEACRRKAKIFDAKLKYREYLDLYEAVL